MENIIINGKEIDLSNIHTLIAENRKLEAVKFIMDNARIGLSEAKNFVDDLIESNEPVSAADEILGELKNLLKNNQKIEAVKLAKSATGLGLKEAKDLVESIDDMTLDELLASFSGKSISRFSSKIQTLNNEGELKNIHSFEKNWETSDKKEKNKPDFEDNSSANKTKAIILILAAIAAVMFYFYYR